VDDTMGDRVDARRHRSERRHRLRPVVLPDERELQAGRTGVDDEN
jgi:hypothetical protein